MTWTHDNLALTNGAQTIKRPAGLTDYGWAKHAEAVLAVLAGSGKTLQRAKLEPQTVQVWTSWYGSPRSGPAYPEAVVQYQLRNGKVYTKRVKDLVWDHDGRGSDIVGWRYARGQRQPWHGRNPAGPPGAEQLQVDVYMRKWPDEATRGQCCNLCWTHDGENYDIVAWELPE